MKVDKERRRQYLEAYEAWQEQLRALHQVLLEGKPMEPPRLKGLLSRESRAKDRYDEARLRLLGLEPPEGALEP